MKAILLVTAAIAFALAPLFSGGLGGFAHDLFPNFRIAPPVQPAGYAFAIWGLIHATLLASALYGLVARSTDRGWNRVRVPLISSLVPGAVWIAVAALSPVWATVLLWWMFAFALLALLQSPAQDRWLLRAPLAIYAGWLTAASWISVGFLGAGYDIGPGKNGWALIALAGVLICAAAIQSVLRRTPEYGLTVIWALLAIVVANTPTHMPLAALATAGIGMMVAVILRRQA
ncbi:hypothetical protein CCR78_03765 [Rhodovulum imhoffii]|nr:hypothetical protein [Rhodovulum imhoffii]